MARRKTNDEFVKEVYELVGDEYVFMERYILSDVNILCRHNLCGHEWSVRPNSFLTRGTRCPRCSRIAAHKKTRKTNMDFISEVYKKVNNEYVFLEEYVGSGTPIMCKHNTCGHIWSVIPSNFLKGSRCPQCFGGVLKSNESFKKEILDLVGNEYEFIEKYVNTATKILCKHNVCNYTWKIRPNDFLQGTRCPQCNRPNYNRDTNHFQKEVKDLVGNDYSVIGEYIGALDKIGFKHNLCGYEWEATPSNFLQGTRCPQCNNSKGEDAVRRYLESNHIKFQREYSFYNLVGLGGAPLRYDFAIFGNMDNGSPFLIEYDGEFHFKKFYENQNFERLQEHDKLKNQYCEDNDIPLLRIPYWEFDNIEKILEDNLNVKLNKKEGDIDDY